MQHRCPALLLFVVLCAPLSAQAQTVESAVVRGVVSDSSGAAIPGAVVRIEPAAGGSARSVVADEEGRFRIDGLAAGPYLLTVAHPGHAEWKTVVDVVAAAASPVPVKLQPAGVTEEVVVTATRMPTPVTAVPNTVTILDEAALQRRTSVSDDLPSVLEANVPGFAPSMKKLSGRAESFRGRNPLYAINGVPQHTPLRDGERDGHTIDLDFIERIEVLHGANAIQGIGATGGIVNMVTKSPRRDGALTQDVKLSFGNSDTLERDGWSSKFSYLASKKFGRVDAIGGVAVQKRGLFFDANGDPVGLYPTQGDIMDSTSRSFYGKVGVDLSSTRRFEVSLNDFRLGRDADFVAVPGNRATGRLSSTVEGDPRPAVGDPAVNDVLTVSADYRDRHLLGGDASVQVYVQDYHALFEGGTFAVFALTTGGPAFLDQSEITTRKYGAKFTWTAPARAGFTPTVGLDLSRDRSEQRLARTSRTWVPPTVFREVAPFAQVQRLLFNRVLVSGGARVELATLDVADFTTLPSARNTRVAGGSPSFTEILPNVGIVVPLTRQLSVYSSFSEGFTMPDVGRVLRAVNVPDQDVDALVSISPVVAGNYEIGGDYRFNRAKLHVAYYRSTSERGALLERDAEGIFSVRRQPTTIDGVDLVGDVEIRDGWRAGATYSWIRGAFDSDRDGTRDTGLDGLNIAPNRVNLFVEGTPHPRVAARLQVSSLLSRRFVGPAAPIGTDFGGYTTADLSFGLNTSAGQLRLGVENLLDKQYVIYFSQVDTARANDAFFAGPGRSFTLSLSRRF
jgi:iron complex outermembrane receptor protein